MTKAQIREAIQKVFNKVMEDKSNDDSLKTLMDLNEQYGDGNRWCNYQSNLKGIIRGGNEQAIDKAFNAYNDHLKKWGAEEAISKVVKNTNGLYF